MALDQRQIKAVDLILSGEYQITQIAELVGVSRGTIYNWLDKEEFKAELDIRAQQIRNMAQKEFDAKLNTAIDKYWQLATDPKTDNRTKQIALSYWIDRSLGKTTSKLEMTDDRKDDNTSEDDILSSIEQYRKKKKNNVS